MSQMIDQEVDGGSQERALFECAHLVLPWLRPADLAVTSLTCKTLNHIVNFITAIRASDASRGFENLPIPFVNAIDGQPYAYFIYTSTPILGIDSSLARQPWGSYPGSDSVYAWARDLVEGARGCECKRCNGELGCPCSNLDSPGLTRECGFSCRCGLECGNRTSQRGVSVRLKVVKHGRKGWGLHAGQLIPRAQFVTEYAGELLTTKETRRRQQIYDQLASGDRFSSALLVVREHLPSGKACMRLNIDATVIGNVSRFINHSCDGGNLSTVLVRSSGALLPRLCFFASRDIQEDEELTFSYGEIRLRSKGLQCFCGSSSCFGTLPSENT
ncbi:hypothetical protein U1Q18_014411 [Sarracenia purpurea var. burkii]